MTEDLTQAEREAIATRLDAGSNSSVQPTDDSWKSNTGITTSERTNEVTPEPTEAAAVVDEQEYAPKLILFREVPGFDLRTLVLSYGEESIDLQFCSCNNKYKKRFAQFLQENPDFLTQLKGAVLILKNNGYQDISIADVLDYLRLSAKLTAKASQYLSQYPHDFTFDLLPRQYLERKLMMEEPELFNFFELKPVKCRSACGYGHSDSPVEDEPEETSLAGF